MWRVWRALSEADAEASALQWMPLASFLVIAVAFIAMFVWLGFLLFRRRRRRAALVMAGISCLGIPIGTLLGGLTIYALTRPEISSEFGPTSNRR